MSNKKSGSASAVDSKSKRMILNGETSFAVREAYHYFRTKLLFTGKGEDCPVFAFTSANAGDGKTLTTINTAISFAELNKRVLIIDADMRNPSVARYLSMKGDHGLSEQLAGIDEKLTLRKTDAENLLVLAAGALPPNPAELLASKRLQTLIESLRAEFDYIFIDTPPAGVVADALALAPCCTGYVIVVQTGTTHTQELQSVVHDIEQIGGDVAGVVLNDVRGKGQEVRKPGYYKKGKSYYYAAGPASGAK